MRSCVWCYMLFFANTFLYKSALNTILNDFILLSIIHASKNFNDKLYLGGYLYKEIHCTDYGYLFRLDSQE